MKTFLVKGIAMVPIEIEAKIHADNQAQAIDEARKLSGRQLEMCIVGNSTDESCVHAFEPGEAEEIL